jgi:hypothetical protein
MFKIILFGIGLSVLAGSTGAAFIASTKGWGLPGALETPVSVRQDSVNGPRGPRFIYFGSRRYVGGGYGYGK